VAISIRTDLRLTGVFSVLPTIFTDDGRLDPDGIRAVVNATSDAGVAGFTALGVMGEAAELTEDERREVLRIAIAAAGDSPVVVGVTGPSGSIVEARAQAARDAGASGLMISPTASLATGPAVGAAATAGLPIVLQDYPAGSGVETSVDEIVAAAKRNDLVVGLKAEAPPTAGKMAAVHALAPELGLLGGLGGSFLIDELRAGATGVMTGFALPERLVGILNDFPTQPERAEADWVALLPLIRFEAFPPFSLAARKEVWRLRGVIGSSYCRRRGALLDERSRDDVRRALAAVKTGALEPAAL
jgi:4-hydroxy-tetrahydrodipicolinate synthase